MCNQSYLREGPEISVCEDDGTGDSFGRWSARAPTCKRIICNLPHRNPVNGAVMCSNLNNEGSVCR